MNSVSQLPGRDTAPRLLGPRNTVPPSERRCPSAINARTSLAISWLPSVSPTPPGIMIAERTLPLASGALPGNRSQGSA